MAELRRNAHDEILATTGRPEPVAVVEDLTVWGRARAALPSLR
jgi:hypothetical protein